MTQGKIDTGETVSEMDGKKGKNSTNRSMRMPSVLAAQALDEAIDLVKNEPKLKEALLKEGDGESTTVTNGMALELLINWATEQFAVKGFGTGDVKFSNQFYSLIDAQVKNVMKGIRNALINCDNGIEAVQKDCNERIKITTDNLALAKAEFESRHEEDATFIQTLETANAELNESKTALSKENEALNSLKDAHEQNAEAWENEKEGLNDRILQLQEASEENVRLLKEQQDYKTRLADMEKELADQAHQHQLLNKEAEIGFQKKLATETANAAAEAEQKLKHTMDAVIVDLKGQVSDLQADLKSQVSELTKQLKAEREDAQKRVDAARAEERAAAEKATSGLQELIKAVGGTVETKKKRGRPRKSDSEK